MTNLKTECLIAAPFTPLRADGTLNLDAVEHYARWLQRNHVVGAFICGTTGECLSLTLDERRQLAERWVTTAPAGLRVVVHVGHNALADCQALAAHAQSIGADSIACISPFFFKPLGVGGLVDWCEQVAAAAPRLPFYFYHMPSMTGVSAMVDEFLRLASQRIPTLAGVKFTFEDLEEYRRCLELDHGRLTCCSGGTNCCCPPSSWVRGARSAAPITTPLQSITPSSPPTKKATPSRRRTCNRWPCG